MNIHELKSLFIQKRSYNNEDVNELMDFAKMTYIYNEISITEYRHLVRELEELGAAFPDEHAELKETEN
jgi:predicted transcriptional regulator